MKCSWFTSTVVCSSSRYLFLHIYAQLKKYINIINIVCSNAQRYIKMFEMIADKLLAEIDPTVRFEDDARDVLEKQRKSQVEQSNAVLPHLINNISLSLCISVYVCKSVYVKIDLDQC